MVRHHVDLLIIKRLLNRKVARYLTIVNVQDEWERENLNIVFQTAKSPVPNSCFKFIVTKLVFFS